MGGEPINVGWWCLGIGWIGLVRRAMGGFVWWRRWMVMGGEGGKLVDCKGGGELTSLRG